MDNFAEEYEIMINYSRVWSKYQIKGINPSKQYRQDHCLEYVDPYLFIDRNNFKEAIKSSFQTKEMAYSDVTIPTKKVEQIQSDLYEFDKLKLFIQQVNPQLYYEFEKMQTWDALTGA